MATDYESLFDNFARYYFLTDFVSLGMAQSVRRKAIERSELKAGSTVIDLMCGTGNNIRHLRKMLGARFNYIGIDASEKMIFIGKKRTADHENYDFMKSDVLDFNNDDIKADHIICTYGLKCIEENQYKIFADQINRLLAVGGKITLTEFQSPKNPVIKAIFNTYLNVFYSALCLVFCGNNAPVKTLMRCLSAPINTALLLELLRQRDFNIHFERSWNDSVINIYGIKQAHQNH